MGKHAASPPLHLLNRGVPNHGAADVRPSFQGAAFQAWRIHSTKSYGMNRTKTAAFSKSTNRHEELLIRPQHRSPRSCPNAFKIRSDANSTCTNMTTHHSPELALVQPDGPPPTSGGNRRQGDTWSVCFMSSRLCHFVVVAVAAETSRLTRVSMWEIATVHLRGFRPNLNPVVSDVL